MIIYENLAFQSTKTQSGEAAAESEDRLPLILCFLLPVVVMLGVFAGKGIYPFGENSFLRTDLYHQYAPFYAEFARILKSGGSLTYTTQIGLGSNFVALYAYYLSSPFNWLLILTPSGAIIEFMSYLVIFKIGLCGFTMGYYLKKRFHRNDIALPVIAIFYALSGYMAAYSWNIMWLDCLWLAPLILLGLERLVRRNQPFLLRHYPGAGDPLQLLHCHHALHLHGALLHLRDASLPSWRQKEEYLRRIACSSWDSPCWPADLPAILLLPAYRCLMTTASADSTFPDPLISYFSILEMLARHMVNVDVEIGLEHWPNIYSGVACFLLLPLYILNPEISAREKIVKTSLLAVMLLSFSLNVLNYIWHGMHYPNSLPCRQSFLYTIVLLTMCYEGLRKIRELTPHQIAAVFWGDLLFILALQIALPEEQHAYYVYYLSILFIAVYTLFLWLIDTERMHPASAMAFILAAAVIESGMNTAVTSIPTTNRTEYWSGTRSNQRLLKEVSQTDTSGFYRVEKVNRRTKNDGAWTGYSSASLFSSTTQASVSDFYKMFGLEGNTNAFSFTGATPLMASFLGVRYMLSDEPLTESDLVSYVGEDDTSYLYRNNDTLPLGFMISDDTAGSFTYTDFSDPAAHQNELVNVSAGTPDVLVQKARSYGQKEFSFTADEDGHYYVYVSNHDITDITAMVGDQTLTFSNVDRGYLLDLGNVSAGTDITLTSDDEMNYDVDAAAYRFDETAFAQWYDVMSRQGMQVTSFTNDLQKTEIKGTVTAQTAGNLLLSLPYDDGWTIQVDGEEITADQFADTFLMIPLAAGTHEITMYYRIPGLIEGAMISISAIIILALLYGVFLIQRRREEARADRYRRARRAATYTALHEPQAEPEPSGQPLSSENDAAAGGLSGRIGGHSPAAGEKRHSGDEAASPAASLFGAGDESLQEDDLDHSEFDAMPLDDHSENGRRRNQEEEADSDLDATQPLPDMKAIRRAAWDDAGSHLEGETSQTDAPTGRPLSDDDIAEILLDENGHEDARDTGLPAQEENGKNPQ